MSLTVEDGTCPAGAASYVSLEEADLYLVPRGLWEATAIEVEISDGGTEETGNAVETPDTAMISRKEAALIRAFDWLNTLDWKGEPLCWQRLIAWPRIDVPMPGEAGEYLRPDTIPQAVKSAQCELAALIFNGRDFSKPVERGGKITEQTQKDKKKVDVIEVETETSTKWADNAPQDDWLPSVYPLLASYLAKMPGKPASGFNILPLVWGG